jgi:hypothetical protein
MLDVAALAWQLYFSGGTTNPFTFLFLPDRDRRHPAAAGLELDRRRDRRAGKRRC